MASQREMQKIRAVQVGFVMRSYRESFVREDGRKGLTQEELLERMGDVDDQFAQRYSHATVSRWESGRTRPSADRIRAFGRAVSLSETEVAGLLLLAGLASDFDSASGELAVPEDGAASADEESTGWGPAAGQVTTSPSYPALGLFLVKRFLSLATLIVTLGFVLSFADWENAPVAVIFVCFTAAVVLAQGFIFPGYDVPLREFFWVSIFFLLSTPLLEFAPILMDHYNFYVIGDFAGTPVPYVLALLVNLVLATVAGSMYHLLWVRQYSRVGPRRLAFRRAALVAGCPVVLVYGIVAVITNLAVTIQFAVLFASFAAVFTSLLLIRDPSLKPSERDQRILFPTAVAAALVSGATGLILILFVYASPNLPSILPDHNLVASWDINFEELGFSREEALQRMNVGYLWHAMCLFIYMLFIVAGRLLVDLYRLGGGDTAGNPSPAVANVGEAASEVESPHGARRHSSLLL